MGSWIKIRRITEFQFEEWQNELCIKLKYGKLIFFTSFCIGDRSPENIKIRGKLIVKKHKDIVVQFENPINSVNKAYHKGDTFFQESFISTEFLNIF